MPQRRFRFLSEATACHNQAAPAASRPAAIAFPRAAKQLCGQLARGFRTPQVHYRARALVRKHGLITEKPSSALSTIVLLARSPPRLARGRSPWRHTETPFGSAPAALQAG